TEFGKAVEVYKRTLEKWPYDPGNPKLQDRVVLAYERGIRDPQKALAEREQMAKLYAAGSEWHKKNRDNKEALDQANEIVETSLLQAAVNHHSAAQNLKKLAQAKKPPDPRDLERVSKEYDQAQKGYEAYLKAYPNSKNTYEYMFSYAETLYY